MERAPGNGIPEPQWQSCGGRPESDQASQGPLPLLLDTLPWGNLTMESHGKPIVFQENIYKWLMIRNIIYIVSLEGNRLHPYWLLRSLELRSEFYW